ncbi:hypothetical protein BpHYR1_002075 [Brachionus plicatilis]|uniref:Uncharacterized protein n=1 Tax=Brachionus plicatilis TaxID=10195 RepID=A0A3M7SUI8_BRAPC|nr:hypothetical protein BpHYR1_002075 [Brachionus plicatilis]
MVACLYVSIVKSHLISDEMCSKQLTLRCPKCINDVCGPMRFDLLLYKDINIEFRNYFDFTTDPLAVLFFQKSML